MALFDINIDDVDTILAIRAAAIELLKQGGTVMTGWSSEGTSVSKVEGVSLEVILEETKDYLQEYDPDLYGRRIKRMRVSYI